MVQGSLITPHEWWAMQVFALSGFGEIRPRIVGLMTVEPQADVMGCLLYTSDAADEL